MNTEHTNGPEEISFTKEEMDGATLIIGAKTIRYCARLYPSVSSLLREETVKTVLSERINCGMRGFDAAIERFDSLGDGERISFSLNPQTRQDSCDAFVNLLGQLDAAVNLAKRAGCYPYEVWLGPKEARILEVEMNWQEKEGMLRHTSSKPSKIIKGDMEGMEINGLYVRLSVKAGVRVSVSWASEDSQS